MEPQLTVPLDEVNRESAINLLAGFPADLRRRLGDHGVLTVQCLIESTTDWLDGTIAKDSHDSNVLQNTKRYVVFFAMIRSSASSTLGS